MRFQTFAHLRSSGKSYAGEKACGLPDRLPGVETSAETALIAPLPIVELLQLIVRERAVTPDVTGLRVLNNVLAAEVHRVCQQL